MATHSSILAWRTPWTEELGGLQSMGCKESDTTEATAGTHTYALKATVKGGQVFLVVMVTGLEEVTGSYNACGASHPLENHPVQVTTAALLRKRRRYLKT